MFIYKFEKGTIKTGVAIDLGTDDEKMFEENFGRFIEVYNDGKHTNEDLEPVHVFATIPKDDGDDEYKLIFTKDVDEINRMKILEDEFRLAWIDDINLKDENKPINIITDDGYNTWVEEEYIKADGTRNKRCHYICVSWM